MSFTSTVASFVAAGAEGVETPKPAWAFAFTAFAFFMALLGVLWSFRNTASKYDTPATLHPARYRDAPTPQGSQGTTDHGAHH